MFTRRLVFRRFLSAVAAGLYPLRPASPLTLARGMVSADFIFTRAPFAMAHASTIAQTDHGLLAAWFGGSLESRPDVAIWLSRRDGGGWSQPERIATGMQDDGTCYPCWNPVLFQPRRGPLMLFYKVGAAIKSWWGMVMTSADGGLTWSDPQRLPDGIFGPIKNKPVQLDDGTLLSPSSTEHDRWRVHVERSNDLGVNWESLAPVPNGSQVFAIQPSILLHADGRLQLLCRSKQRSIAESWSGDGGFTWSRLDLTGLPNPNSGTDAVTLADGRQLLVYNHSARNRSPLNVALSEDGERWRTVLTLEKPGLGEYSYPAVIQGADGLVHVTYSWLLCRIKHVVLDPEKLGERAGGG